MNFPVSHRVVVNATSGLNDSRFGRRTTNPGSGSAYPLPVRRAYSRRLTKISPRRVCGETSSFRHQDQLSADDLGLLVHAVEIFDGRLATARHAQDCSEAPPQTAETRSASGSASLPPVLACPASRGLDISEGEPTGRTKLASFVTICAFGDA